MRALGVDIGVRKGLDAVVLDASMEADRAWRGLRVDSLGELIDWVRPDIVAIDSPPAWAKRGRSRAAERAIAAIGIHSFATPTPERGLGHPFYRWMEVGFQAFSLAGERGFPRYGRDAVARTAIEVFPHASAVTLMGALPPRSRSPRARRLWRTAALERRGVRTETLRSMDQVDAALAALTGLEALRGLFVAVGDPDEGVIVLPTASLPERRYERRDATGA